jgi:6-phosphofructokinase
MLESGRDKISTPQEFESSLDVCNELELDGLVICGGDDSNTNAAALAEYFKAHNSKCCVRSVLTVRSFANVRTGYWCPEDHRWRFEKRVY